MKDQQLIQPAKSSREGLTVLAPTTVRFYFESPILPWREQSEKFMAAYIEHVLEQTNGNISAASRILKMHRAGLYKWMKRCEIKRVKLVTRDCRGRF